MPEAVTSTSTPGSTEPRKRHNQYGASKLVQRQSALLRLSSTIVEAQDEREVCERVVNGLHDPALGYDSLALFMLDAITGKRVLRATAGWNDAPAGTASVRTGSELDVPLKVGEKVIGVLVARSSARDSFRQEDVEILNAAVNQASIAIARARLLVSERQRADEQKALLDTMADLSSERELSKLLQGALERADWLLHCGDVRHRTALSLTFPRRGKVPEGRKGDVEDGLPRSSSTSPFRRCAPPSPSGGRERTPHPMAT